MFGNTHAGWNLQKQSTTNLVIKRNNSEVFNVCIRNGRGNHKNSLDF